MAYVNKSGFTLVEMVVIIFVLVVLITLAAFGLSKYLSQGRDTHRVSDVTTISERLEKYFDKNGEYPPCVDLQGDVLVIKNGPIGIESEALVAPTSVTPGTSSITCSALSVDDDSYAYVGVDCDAESCAQWQLQYYDEANDTIVSLSSRRVAVAAPVVPTDPFEIELSGTTFTANEVTTICSSSANAPVGYNVMNVGSPTGNVNGTASDDVIYRTGGLGNTFGNNGNDIICITNGTGNSDGGIGNDIILREAGMGSITGGDGNDSIWSVAHVGNITGGDGDDVFYAHESMGNVDGGNGYDKLHYNGGISVPNSTVEEIF